MKYRIAINHEVKQVNRMKTRAAHLLVILITFVFWVVPANAQTAANTNTTTQSTCTPERLLVPGGIATHDGSVGFFPDIDSGIVALRLRDGKQLWKTQSAQIPIGVVGLSLVSQRWSESAFI